MKSILLFIMSIVLFSCQSYKNATRVETSGKLTVIENIGVIPGQDEPRTIRVYTPPGYTDSDERYPVLYMHDGQNLFEDSTSFAGEWGIDETLDSLSNTSNFDLIVVGIDNGGENRIHELTAWDHPQYGKAEGEAYMSFLVDVVKPYMDENFRTKPDRPNTGVMGSSLGGLISHYAIYKYPEVFSKAGVFSPSYWWGTGPFEQVERTGLPSDARLNFLMGEKEGAVMVVPMQQMVEKILDKGHPDDQLTSKINPEGEHNEKFWRSEFSEAVLWLFNR
ncbi:alpha/beta hydrolase [Roseivirga sp. E12]|uniref:alpha/beta hydrolase n=1 Tax=Roseivirga sp. E12 TaxID=2819237 RepID=UPI001ABD1853|nr:alpha/beta hydrolase-fold protein [Roseivirga sp. E12]MBO3700414.1 alpha/beta hydrolase [Roseivirga sp. E12]